MKLILLLLRPQGLPLRKSLPPPSCHSWDGGGGDDGANPENCSTGPICSRCCGGGARGAQIGRCSDGALTLPPKCCSLFPSPNSNPIQPRSPSQAPPAVQGPSPPDGSVSPRPNWLAPAQTGSCAVLPSVDPLPAGIS